MKNIVKIFKNDLKKITRNVLVFIVVIGISVLPALYAWFNIAANWDPYSNTGSILVAVANNDTGYTFGTLSMNCGEQIVTNLKQNTQMGWTFVSEQEAIDGVESGEYYAAVVIPESFSEDICSVATGELNRSKIKYYVNEKKNAIAPKITDKGPTAIESEVKSTFVSTVTTIIATALDITTDELENNKSDISGKIITSLEDIKDNMSAFEISIDVFTDTLNTLEGLIKTNQEVLPDISELLSQSGTITSSAKDAIDSTHSASSQITGAVSEILSSTETMQDNINTQVSEAFASVQTSSSEAADKLRSTMVINSKIIGINNTIISILEKLSDNFNIDNYAMINKLESANERQQSTIEMLTLAADTLTKTGSLPVLIQQEITTQLTQSKSDIASLKSSFEAAKRAINTAIDNLYDTLDSISGLMTIIDEDIPQISDTLDSACNSLEEINKTFESVKTLIINAEEKIDNLIIKVNELNDSDKLNSFISKIIDDPTALGEFVAAPMEVETKEIYPVDNYGSGMAPFYTTLALWVGGIVLIAVMKTEPSGNDIKRLDNPTTTQQFFGKYLTFFMLGEVQALIIALGDIFFLGIQCKNIGLFILASMISSFVFTLIIYTLTLTFSVIGKALAVIILVIQIAGSGGTFPVEVLPDAFKSVYPYLPFNYSVNALRECISGVCMTDYLKDILCLLVFVPIVLIIGLLLRKPCIRIMDYFNKQLEESEFIV